jgi:hypothetical protein
LFLKAIRGNTMILAKLGSFEYALGRAWAPSDPADLRIDNAELAQLHANLGIATRSVDYSRSTMENVSENLGVMASPPPQPQLDLLVGEQLPSEFFKVEGESLVPKKTAQQRGQKRKLANSRSATPGTINGDEVGGVGVDASRRSSETPVSHRYAVTQPDEDARLKSIAKMGTKVLGSGDGGERGEECFTWTDLPMNRLGELTRKL